MSDEAPIILWFRRDLRLSDHRALAAAAETKRPIIPVFIRDAQVDALGAAPKFRLSRGLARFAEALAEKGSALILRSGAPQTVLPALCDETGARSVWWSRAYDGPSVERDTETKAVLKERGLDPRSFTGHLMFEPWTVTTKVGDFYKVYTPFWKSVRGRDVPDPVRRPHTLRAPDTWPKGDALEDWQLEAAMGRGADVVAPYLQLGEDAAQARLDAFIDSRVTDYDDNRDLPWKDGTSNLSENLALGEISPTQAWHAGRAAMEAGKSGAETFLKELVWREFAYHLAWHTPRLLTDNWRQEWDAFPWNTEEADPHVQAWMRGRTGIRFVDAGMREMYVTGRMHNRARMITASYLTKHLMTHWRIGQRWFENHLIDWDPASNAMGWQWSAGSGPDATPYFRVFNPVTQLDKFDKQGAYINRWIAEGQGTPSDTALSYFDAIPKSWAMSPTDPYPDPVVDPSDGRARALEAYSNRDF